MNNEDFWKNRWRARKGGRILILNHNQERYGTYYRCYHLGQTLARAGYHVTMVCASGKTFDLRVRRRDVMQSDGRMTLITLPRVKYHRYFTGQIARLVLTLPIVLRQQCDLVHAFTVAQPQIAVPAVLRRLLGHTPLVVDWDDLWGGGFADEHPVPVRLVLATGERIVPRFADAVTVASRYLYSEALRLGLPHTHVAVIPNGCQAESFPFEARDEARAALGLDPDVPLIVSVGNMYTRSLETLLAAFDHVLRRRPESRLALVGAVHVPAAVRGRFHDAMRQVSQTGPVPFPLAARYMCAADALALPMDQNLIEEARFPIRLGDYLCSGRPIVSNAVGEVRRYLEAYRCGVVVPVRDAQAFGDALLRTLEDREVGRVLGERARALSAGLLSWRTVAAQIDRIYDRALSTANGASRHGSST